MKHEISNTFRCSNTVNNIQKGNNKTVYDNRAKAIEERNTWTTKNDHTNSTNQNEENNNFMTQAKGTMSSTIKRTNPKNSCLIKRTEKKIVWKDQNQHIIAKVTITFEEEECCEGIKAIQEATTMYKESHDKEDFHNFD